MKRAFLLIAAAFILSSSRGYSQTISFSGKNVQLTKVFSAIKSQTGYVFFYDAALLREAKPVTVDLKDVSLEEALQQALKDQPLGWLIENKTITIIRKALPVINVQEANAVPLITVTGTVMDEENKPIEGASVIVKGTGRGTSTNENGAFSINVNKGDMLVFSSVNHINREVKVERSEMNITLQLQVKPMEELLVGGNLSAMKRKAETYSITVLDTKTLEKIPEVTLDKIFRGWVTGTNTLDVGSESEGFSTLNIRGSGSPNFFTNIAVYIDGIEYAGGSGYLSVLDKTNIDRIEIVKGPGAATLYGTGSNGGIVQIFTKKPRPGQTSISLMSSAGFYKSKWVQENAFQQFHTVETTTGFENLSLTLGGSFRSIGAYVPDGGEKNKGFYGNGQLNVGRFRANFLTRFNVRNFHLPRDPYYDTTIHPRTDILINNTPAYQALLVSPKPPKYRDGITETSIYGINLSYRTKNNWAHYLDAGFTSNKLSTVPTPANALQSSYSSKKTGNYTLRYYNVVTIRNSKNDLATIITSGAEYKKSTAYANTIGSTITPTNISQIPDNKNYGAFVQINPSYRNLYLTLGMRLEKNELFKETWNPRVGLTTNFSWRSLIIKPRIAWGKGISSPTYAQRFGTTTTVVVVIENPELKPQHQQGFDYGLEVYGKRGRFKFEAIYYNNEVQNMVGRKSLGQFLQDSGRGRFVWMNACQLSNTGWEFSAQHQIGHFNLQATFSLINTTLKDTSGAYLFAQLSGNLPGTRLPIIPKHTAGLFVTYNFYKLFGRADKGMISLSATEVGGIIAREVKQYNMDVAYGRTPYVGGLPGYPIETSPVVRVGLFADYFITGNMRLFIQGSNILNDNTYEVSSDYITHGATWLFGLKYNCSKTADTGQ